MKLKSFLTAAALALSVSAAPSWAQMGPGMMGGGMGPGMMGGGYGMGPGMGGGYGGCPMMGGYGMGPGMMGGYGGYPGMMGGGYGMGPGMMGGYYGAYGNLDLTPEQRAQIRAIRHDLMQKRWDLMEQMHEQAETLYGPGEVDEQVARRAYDAMAATRKQLFEAQLDANKRMAAVLTAEQRARLGGGSARMPAPAR